MWLKTTTYIFCIALCSCLTLCECSAAELAAEAAAEYKHGNYKAAEPLFKKLIVAEPGNSRAQYYLALVYLKLNNIPAAQELFRLIVITFPGSQEADYSERYLNEFEAKSSAAASKNAPQTPPAQAENDIKADKDLSDAAAQAELIRVSAKSHAQQITNQANSMAAELREVKTGKAMVGRAYSDEAIDAATLDLRNQAKYIIDAGEREAMDVMNRAQMRHDAETRHSK